MSTVTLCGTMGKGYKESSELLGWRQLKGAYDAKLVLAPIHFLTMDELVDSLEGKRVFLIPPGRMKSVDFEDYTFPKGDINFIFGTYGDNLVRYVTDQDDVVSIHTPYDVDLMSISVAGIVLNRYNNEHRQQNNHQ